MINVKGSFLFLVFVFICGLGFIGGIRASQILMLREVFDSIAPTKLFQAVHPPAFPTLQIITNGATSDSDAIDRVFEYYQAHRAQIADELKEENEDRLKGLFVMNVVHMSHIYDSVPDPGSFLDYLKVAGSHCGTYAHYQAEISERFGVPWRLQSISGGTHTWVEINVDGQWEIFDATINTWIDHSGAELMRGVARSYRAFYTPMMDAARDDAVNPNLASVQRLRMYMPGLGLYYHPLAVIENGVSSSQNVLYDQLEAG